jgi:hypothetical protein
MPNAYKNDKRFQNVNAVTPHQDFPVDDYIDIDCFYFDGFYFYYSI